MKSARVLAVDLGASHVRCAVLRRVEHSALQLEQCAVERIDSDPAGDAGWCAAAGRAWRGAMARIQYRGECRIAIPGHLALTKSVRTPAIAAPGRKRVVAFEAAQGIPYPLGEVWWDHLVLADSDSELELLLMAVRREEMAAVCAAAAAAACRPARATPTAVALHRAFLFNYPELPEPVLLVSVGARSTHLLACAGERVRVRTVALGGRDVTQAIAAGLAIGFAAAEAVKFAAGDEAAAPGLALAERQAAVSAQEQFARRLQLEVARSLAGLPEQRRDAGVQRILLTGGASRGPWLAAALHAKFGVPVERFASSRRITHAPPGSDDGELDALGPLIGLAADESAGSRALGNVLPPSVVRAAAGRRRRPMLFAAAALVVLGTSALALHLNQQAVRAAAATRAEIARVQELRAVAQRQAVLRMRLDQLRAAHAEREQFAAERTYWVRLLADLQQRIEHIEGAWLDEFIPAPVPPARTDKPGTPANTPEWQIVIAGRLAELDEPVGLDRNAVRVRRLLAALAGSPFVTAVDNERFDLSEPGLLRFGCRLAVRRYD